MNKQMVARLSALEGMRGDGLPAIVVRFIVDADGAALECRAFRDGRGNLWRREAGETLETFESRASALAIAAAAGGVASIVSIIPCDDGGE